MPETGKKLIVLVTAETQEEAARIARHLLEEKLAACINIVPAIRSLYEWEGKIEDDPESLMIIKTRAALFEKLEARVRQLHSYDVPEIIATTIDHGSSAYLGWIDEVTGA